MTDIVRVNSTILSWNSCIFKVDGIPYNGILEFNYEQKRERKVVHAARRDGRPLGKTAGKYSVPSCTLKMLRDSADKLTTYLTAKGLGSYGDAEFLFFVQYFEPVIGAVPITVVCEGCTVDGKKDPNAEGVDELATEFEIGVLQLTENQKRLWSVIRSIP
jgi:hypothetical protein